MTVATQKLSVPSLLTHPAGKGCPRKRRGGRTEVSEEKKKSDRERDSERNLGKARSNERRSSKVGVGVCGGGGSPGRITPPCLEAPLCNEMRMALCT